MIKRQVRHTLLITVLIVLVHSPCLAQRVWQDSVAVTLPAENVGEDVMRFRYLLPAGYDETQSEKYPLLLYLHGAGNVGTDNEIQISTAVPELLSVTDANYPAILVAPQIQQGPWDPSNRAIDRTDSVLFYMIDEFSVDTNRLYLTGVSMGGFGTMTYLEHFNANNPDLLRFAAAAPLGGSWFNPNTVAALSDTPIWISHGSLDDVVDVAGARATFNALAGRDVFAPILPDFTAANGPTSVAGTIRYTEYPDGQHGIWNRIYGHNDFYDWMFSQSLVAGPVDPGTPIAGTLIAGWEQWASNGNREATQTDGITTGTTSNNMGNSNGFGLFTGGSTDGTWGTMDTPIADASTDENEDGYRLTNGEVGSIDFVLTDTGGVDRDLALFQFDTATFRPNAANSWELSVIAGDLTPGTVMSGVALNSTGGVADWHDVDIDLTGLTDHTLDANGTVTFRLEFTGGTLGAGGHHQVLDNVAISEVQESGVLLGDVDLNGTVDFDDIPAFIAVLIGGGFQFEADCDGSGVVDFDDIPAFVAILIGA